MTKAQHPDLQASQQAGRSSSKARDPVCGMTVDAANSQHRFEYSGETFHFCSERCRSKFGVDPAQYLTSRKPKADAAEGTIYTSLMHPHISQSGPGRREICDLAF